MNASSSRSHSIITITIQMEPVDALSNATGASHQQCLSAKLHLVDLAGSERAKRTAVTGERFAEGVEINKGLFSLAKVISALADNASRKDSRSPKRHVPYRDSKLTRLLQDSLGGNARTLLVACVSPADTSREETLGTLRYAETAKCIRNKPKVNTEADSVEISDLRANLARARADIANLEAENERLRSCLASQRSVQGRPNRTLTPRSLTPRSPMSSRQTSSLTSSCGSTPPLLPHMDPLIVTRDDELISGLKYRITQLEGLLDRANLSVSDRDALLGRSDGKVASRSPLGKLKNVGLAALSHVDASDAKRKVEAKIRNAHGPRRRARAAKIEPGSLRSPSTARRREYPTQKEAPKKGPVRFEPQTEVNGVIDFRCQPQSGFCNGFATEKRLPRRATTRSCREKQNCMAGGDDILEELDGKTLHFEDDPNESSVMNGLSAARLDEMRRTFVNRLRQAEDDKASLDSKAAQLSRQVVTLQKKHEKEIEDLKASHHSRLAAVRTKINDVKRLQAQSTRLTKLRDGSDAARKKMQGKLKVTERQRHEMASKVDDAQAQAESMKRTLVKERKEMAKAERSLRAELRRAEMGKSRYEAVIGRLRMENAAMKNKMRDGGRYHVRRVNSSISQRSTTSAAT
ncbi:Kinesin-like protein [Chondrus crispus]|uniref:Kinesin-like protein n=1 Tax=Chondrus crispus TaxID=2769 RepID=R7QII5_CHOCR|nr:Kinesin-like protein [Chondrus crispus]CDF37548.1 Kinesin-like protein [Chondrus crispus]|eukprot:XP_005717419.1 Kinesin-like protein [Chondrus crispus]